MKCVSVYTKDFAVFSEIYEQILQTPLSESEETVVEGITVSESGDVPHDYLDKMRTRADVVVLKEKERNITILQHGRVFEILLPYEENVLH